VSPPDEVLILDAETAEGGKMDAHEHARLRALLEEGWRTLITMSRTLDAQRV
jgi:hypothetical protein